jgi:hypothetical protein
LGLGAGVAREVGEIALPDGIRRSQLYQSIVDTTLRFLIEQVGGVKGVYTDEGGLPDDFLARRTAGNVVEALGIVAFRASPVWILAALADLSGLGRQLIPEMADALKAEGLLATDVQYTSVDQMLDGLERTSSRLASAINTPPLDVAGLRKEWELLRHEALGLQRPRLPSREQVRNVWMQLKAESQRQNRSVFETSSVIAMSAVRLGATHTGRTLGAALLDHYTQTLNEMQEIGYLRYAGRQFHPYLRAAVDQFAPSHQTFTQRALEKIRHVKLSRQRKDSIG